MKRSIYRNLLYAMLALGTGVGLIFPIFARVALDSARALSPLFFGLCISAGLLVGGANYLLFSVVVSRAIKRLVRAMGEINEHVAARECRGLECAEGMHLSVASADPIGATARAFNDMIDAIALRLGMEGSIHALLERLAASVEIEDVSQAILHALARVSGAPVGLLYGEGPDGFQLLAHLGADTSSGLPRRLDPSQGCVQQALQHDEVLLVAPEREGLHWVTTSAPLGSFRPASLLLLPLMVSTHAAGLVVLASPRPILSAPQRTLLDALRTQAAPHLQNAALHQKIKQLAAIDDMTGVLNRRFGLKRLGEEFSRSVRHGVPVSVLLMDVDHFKRFNDTHGHDAGDRVLQMVARTIEETVRAGDVVCRYGGEEFLVVVPGTGVNDAAQLGERLRRGISATEVSWGDQALRVTVSLGQATWPVSRAALPEELVTAADAALYKAKEAGRDCLMVHLADRVASAATLRAAQERAA